MNAKTLMTTAFAGLLATAAHAITSEEIAAALDIDSSVGTFSLGGVSDWKLDQSTIHEGTYSMRSGAIASPSSSWPSSDLSMSINVKEPVKISFWVKTSCYDSTSYAKLTVIVDDATYTYTGATDWKKITGVFVPGNHTIKWSYAKRFTNVSGSDCAWVDQFEIEPVMERSTEVEVVDVKCKQRYPWNGMVDIDYTVKCEKKDAEVWVYPVGYDKDSNTTMAPRALSGDGVDAPVSNGTFRMTWKVTDDYPNFHSTAFTVKMAALVGAAPYMVVDLSGGVDALSYPVSYLSSVPAGGWSDEYKTTKMVLRLIPPGSFMMGSPTDELGRNADLAETLHGVVLTKPFYIGVFECTQKQYELVMGSNPSTYKGDARPVENVSYNDLRGSVNGAGWPTHNQVDANSFFGRLRSKANMFFDLPTESQWEYACRAGTSTALNSGKNISNVNTCAEANEVGRYAGNTGDKKGGYSQHTTVGSYLENAWGLYDMHGNAQEWCRDWYVNDLGVAGVIDPSGATSGSSRSVRGGTYQGDHHNAKHIRSAARRVLTASSAWFDLGFRVMCSPVAE